MPIADIVTSANGILEFVSKLEMLLGCESISGYEFNPTYQGMAVTEGYSAGRIEMHGNYG
jgi:hypothetical protein